MTDRLSEYSPFTQTAVKAWRRLFEPRNIGGSSYPYIWVWFIVTGALLLISVGWKTLALAIATSLFFGELLAVTIERSHVRQH